MDTSNPKQAIVDKIKKSTNILVTVAHDPSVDALAAALGFTLMLNKLDKHATAVFSGAVPPAITFLQPEKTFEGTVDSLRDFIIALDKEKADRLRYKVEGDVVRIYITPYRTNISEKDLQYSQGDFNVDLIIALGVEQQSDLDQAIASHGRILHDAAVATINVSDVKSTIGTIDWSDNKASSLCEMLMSLSEALQSNLLDDQIATALLTGIVAATNRFGNSHTSPRVMTMSAQLMAAGANQQLIAEKLQQTDVVVRPAAIAHDTPVKLTNQPAETAAPVSTPQPTQAPVRSGGEMHVVHEDEKRSAAIQTATDEAESLAEVAADDRQEAANAKLEAALGHIQPFELSNVTPAEPTPAPVSVPEPVQEPVQHESEPAPTAPATPASSDWRDAAPSHESYREPLGQQEPLMGGTLNATTNEAEEAARAEERSNRNRTILSHDSPGASSDASTFGAAQPDRQLDAPAAPAPIEPPHLEHDNGTRGKTLQPLTMSPIASPSGLSYEETPVTDADQIAAPTIADLQAEVEAAAVASPVTQSIDDARAAVSSAFSEQPLSVGGQITPAFPVTDTAAPAPAPIVPPIVDVAAPPMPDFSTLPPLPPMPGQEVPQPPYLDATQPAVVEQPAAPAAPNQFQIPGQ